MYIVIIICLNIAYTELITNSKFRYLILKFEHSYLLLNRGSLYLYFICNYIIIATTTYATYLHVRIHKSVFFNKTILVQTIAQLMNLKTITMILHIYNIYIYILSILPILLFHNYLHV